LEVDGKNYLTVVDGSGNVIGRNYDTQFVKSGKIRTEDIFACPNYEDIFDSFDCLKTITKNVFTTLYETNEAVQNGEATNALKSIGTGTQSGDMSNITYTGSDLNMIIMVGAWNKSMDATDPWMKYGRMIMIAGILVFLLSAFLLIAAVIRSK
jgi:folylpolyglutamate synthase/dihydropteroate synthase